MELFGTIIDPEESGIVPNIHPCIKYNMDVKKAYDKHIKRVRRSQVIKDFPRRLLTFRYFWKYERPKLMKQELQNK